MGRYLFMIGLMSLFLPTVGMGRNAGNLICTCRQIHFGHSFSGIKKWYWPSLHFLCLDHVIKFYCSWRSGCFQSVMILFFWFMLLLKYCFNFRVASRRKKKHRQYLPLLLPILSGRDQVLLRGRLSVWHFVVLLLDLRLRIFWRSVPKIITMTHLGLFLGRLLYLPWRPEIVIQWYLWLLPQPVSSLVSEKLSYLKSCVKATNTICRCQRMNPSGNISLLRPLDRRNLHHLSQAWIRLALVLSTFTLAWGVTVVTSIEKSQSHWGPVIV